MGIYAQVKTTCIIHTTDTQKLITTGSFVGDTDICIPYFQCMPGYYKQFPSATCEPCTNTLPTSKHVYATPGLTDNQPASCLTRCQHFDTWPAGECQSLSTNAYAPTNPPGEQVLRAGTRLKGV
jgi:hypothetical protein